MVILRLVFLHHSSSRRSQAVLSEHKRSHLPSCLKSSVASFSFQGTFQIPSRVSSSHLALYTVIASDDPLFPSHLYYFHLILVPLGGPWARNACPLPPAGVLFLFPRKFLSFSEPPFLHPLYRGQNSSHVSVATPLCLLSKTESLVVILVSQNLSLCSHTQCCSI